MPANVPSNAKERGRWKKPTCAGIFSRLFEHMSPEEEHDLRDPGYVMEMPQSGERIRGRENMRSMQENYPGPPSIALRRVVEFRDGKILRETRYYADPFEAPEWRARWVESMEDR